MIRTRRLLTLAFLIAGCNAEPRVIDAGPDDQVVTLPGGGALILRAARQRQDEDMCLARARSFRGLVPIPCSLAETARP